MRLPQSHQTDQTDQTASPIEGQITEEDSLKVIPENDRRQMATSEYCKNNKVRAAHIIYFALLNVSKVVFIIIVPEELEFEKRKKKWSILT